MSRKPTRASRPGTEVLPPRLAAWILGRLNPDRGAFSPADDFAEVYAELVDSRGRNAAGVWYRAQILASLPGFFRTRFYWSVVMFRNYFVIALRNLVRDRVGALINLAGLAAGMACFLLILTYVRFESGYDRFHSRADRICRVLSTRGNMGTSVRISDKEISLLRTEIPGISRVASIFPPFTDKPILEVGEKQYFQQGLFADGGFLEMFSFPVLRGAEAGGLGSPSSIALTRSVAAKLFGREDALGRTVVWKDMGQPRTLTVTAVIEDVPPGSHLKFDYLISLETLRADPDYAWMFKSWGVANYVTYVELAGDETAASLESRFDALAGGAPKMSDLSRLSRLRLQPLPRIHLRSDIRGDIAVVADARYVRLFLAAAFLILGIACLNHVNMATARASMRAREIGLRKVTGAFRTQIFRQFLGEAFVIVLLAGVLALGLVALLLPWFNSLAGVSLRLSLLGYSGFLPGLAATVLVVTLAAGIYPAFVLSGLTPVRTVREYSSSGRKGARLRNILVVSQFAASVALIIGAVVVYGQMGHIRALRLGYDRENVVIIPAYEKVTVDKLPAIKNSLLARPEVAGVSLCSGLPTKIGQHWSGEAVMGDGTKVPYSFYCDYVDENFLEVFRIELAAGRGFRPGAENEMLLSETAVRELQWDSPIGKKFGNIVKDREVVGIVKDFQFGSVHAPAGPLALFNEGGDQLAVRIRPGDLRRTMSVLREVFEANTHGQPFDFYFLDDAFDALYRKEIRAGRIFGTFAGLAVFISLLGLLGLTAFNLARRRREIAVRKVLGAPVGRLVLLLNGNFVRLIVLANALAWPLTYLAARKWLSGFAFQMPLRPWVFLLSGLISLAAALLVVCWQTLRAARDNPADTLRYE